MFRFLSTMRFALNRAERIEIRMFAVRFKLLIDSDIASEVAFDSKIPPPFLKFEEMI